MRAKQRRTAAEVFVDGIAARLTPLGPIASRRLFSGFGLYLEDTIFAIAVRGRLFLKVDDKNRLDFVRRGFAQLTYEGRSGVVGLPYWEVPSAIIDDPRALRRWARKAHAAGVRAKERKVRGSLPRQYPPAGARASLAPDA
ncbi:MAG TPA: TfoX/Sxy family protein [Alphaproteobacteria bacterium]|nr:TfoX/Sxy family protein [Alphaproteobacteria bacterium]